MNIFKQTKQKAWSRIGNRCSEYAEGCVVCEAYRHLGEFGKFPDTDEELWVYMDKIRDERKST
jgi:hypothetical protein